MISRWSLVVFAGCLLTANVDAQSPLNPRLDALGDPLPDGAVARLGTLRFKHGAAVDSTVDVAVFSPDGSKIASLVYGPGSIRLWDAVTGKEIPGPWSSTPSTAIAFSPDGTMLAAAARNPAEPAKSQRQSQRQVAIYDIARATQVKTINGQGPSVRALLFADQGRTLVLAGNGVISWWDVATGTEKRSWKPLGDEKQPAEGGGTKTKTFNECAISPDAKYIALHAIWTADNPLPGGRRGNEPVDQEGIGFDLATGKMNWLTSSKQAPNGKTRFAFSADSKRVAIALGPQRVEVRNAVTGKLVTNPLENSFSRGNWLGGLALSSDGTTGALAGADSEVLVWSIDGKKSRHFVARMAQYWGNSTECLHFSPDNKTLLVGVDADLQLYDVATLRELRAWEGHRGWIDFVSFSPDGSRLLTGSAALGLQCQEMAAWDVATRKRLQRTAVREPPWPNFGFASPNQAFYIGKSGDDQRSLFDLKSGKLLARFRLPGKGGQQNGGVFSPSGNLYLLGRQDEQGKPGEALYRVPSGKLLCQLPPMAPIQGAMESVRPYAFSSDERLVALFCQEDGRIHICDTTTGESRHRLGQKVVPMGQMGPRNAFAGNLAFSRSAKFLASWTSAESVIRVWDVATGKELLQIAPEETGTSIAGQPSRQPRVHFAWSPDGRTLAVGENNIQLWELATNRVRRKWTGHEESAIRALAYSPDGRFLASGSADTTVLIWDMSLSDRAAAVVSPQRWEPASLWQALAEDDGPRAFAAIGGLAAAPEKSVPWIQQHLPPAAPIDPKRIEELIGQLEDNRFRVRQQATAELLRIGERVVPAIDRVLAGNPVLESRLRLQAVRARVTGLVLKAGRLQAYRAMEVLERIGTPEARQVLQALAGGSPGALATTQAQETLARLQK